MSSYWRRRKAVAVFETADGSNKPLVVSERQLIVWHGIRTLDLPRELDRYMNSRLTDAAQAVICHRISK
jgi:hypothetical protein